MASGQLRIEYNVMLGLSNSFASESHDIQQMYQSLRNNTEHLQGSGWKGVAADKWFREQESLLLPATLKLAQILNHIADLIKQLNSLFQAAEAEVGGLFKRVG